jgi:hypothetical protein
VGQGDVVDELVPHGVRQSGCIAGRHDECARTADDLLAIVGEHRRIVADHEPVHDRSRSDQSVAGRPSVLADVVPAVADDVDDRPSGPEGSGPEQFRRMVDRLRKIGQPADVECLRIPRFPFDIDAKTRFDRAGDRKRILFGGDEHPWHHLGKLVVVPGKHRKPDPPVSPALNRGEDLGRADRPRHALDLQPHVVQVDRIGDIERGNDIGVRNDFVRETRAAEELHDDNRRDARFHDERSPPSA